MNITVANSVVHDPRLIVAQSTDSSTGIARLAIVAEGYIIAGPVTGNLFNILYKVLSSTKGTAIVFQTGCSGTSVPSTCVTVVNGNTVDPEMVQTATFGGTATPDFTIAANPLSQTVQQGSQLLAPCYVSRYRMPVLEHQPKQRVRCLGWDSPGHADFHNIL
ncbi:MAG: hypothetical protein AUJ07_09430 [Crenarchaeota archaeon 13_1_40CM_3_53_5]|nr:MAG: hypothetical protein AUJ07_09430 [Crenarchaeota archaeon 13_1_40CM_3_53_5]